MGTQMTRNEIAEDGVKSEGEVKDTEPRICKHRDCNKKVTTRDRRKKFCSDKCRVSFYSHPIRSPERRECEICGDEFSTTRRVQKLCGKAECKRKRNRKFVEKWQAERRKFKEDAKEQEALSESGEE